MSQTTRQAIAAQNRSVRGTVTGKLKNALTFMVWQGDSRKDAAQKAQMTDHGLREALRKPHVRQFYSRELDVLRTSEKARTISRLAEIRDQDDNRMAAVAAAKALEAISDAAPPESSQHIAPGLIIQIINAPPVLTHDAIEIIPIASVSRTEGD